jgi:tetratricopeptide (TPR) repeat protein
VTRHVLLAALAALILGAAALPAQESPALRQARAHYDGLFYDSAVAAARRALDAPRVSAADRAALYELLGYAYATMDSTSPAVAAFRELILLDPDREPDQVRVSPRITSRYTQALSQVLVVRRLSVDSAGFVAGEGRVNIRFQLSRAAIVRTTVRGGTTQLLDSASLAGGATVGWDGTMGARTPAAPGRYQVIVEAMAGRETDARSVTIVVTQGALDTLEHLTALPGYLEQAESEQPPRSWAPLTTAAAYFSAGLAASLAMHNASFGSALPAGLAVVGTASLASGFLQSRRPPPPRPVAAAILYNRLLRDMLARRNQEIARDNATNRRKVLLTVVPDRQAAP